MADEVAGEKPDVEDEAPAARPQRVVALGQTHLAEAFAALRGDQFIYVHGMGWHYWDETRWALDTGEARVRQELLYVLKVAYGAAIADPQLATSLRACYSDSGQRGALSIAATSRTFSVVAEQLNADPYLINCANGTLDLHTYELRPHDPKDLITKITRAAYDEDAKSELFDSFLERVLPDADVRHYLQRVMGLALLGKQLEHIMPIGTGSGQNGKGKFYGAALHAWGDYGHAAEQDLFLATRSMNGAESAKPAMLALFGKRFVVCSETNEGASFNAALMKNLTGGDKITARAVYGKVAVTFDPSHTALLITNHLPKVRGDDDAVWRRIRVIPFDVVIPPEERDGHLGEKLELEADAIFAWAVQGWRDYVDAGYDMQEPQAVLARTSDYRNESDSIASFIKECMVVGEGEWVSRAELTSAWQAYSAAEKVEKIGMSVLFKKLEELGFTPFRDRPRGRGFEGLSVIPAEQGPVNEEGVAEL